MTIRKRAGSVLFTAAAAAAVVGISVGPALASTHLTVKVSHGGSYTAKAKGRTTLKDGNLKVTCNGSKGSGKLASGTYRGTAPVKLGTVSSLKFTGCTGPLGALSVKVIAKPVLEANSKTNSKGQTDAIVGNVKVKVSQTGCSFEVTGNAPGYYTNGKHTLTMTPKPPIKEKARLTIKNVSGCAGLIRNGQHPTYSATYVVSRHITIKSS